MFRSYLISALILLSANAHTQEFQEHNNGLIYSDTTIKALRFIVDSMNLKYRKCDPWKDYYALSQTKCHAIILDSTGVKKAMHDIKNGIGFEDFCKKYPRASIQKDLLVIRSKEKDYDGKLQVEFSTLEVGNAYGRSIECDDTTLYDKQLGSKWVYEHSPKSKYSNESIEAFYFVADFTSEKLPEKYSRMIQYADCMIDTNSRIFLENATRSYRFGALNKNAPKTPKMDKLEEYIGKHTLKPQKKEYKTDSAFESAYYIWLNSKDSVVDATLSNDRQFALLVKEAIAEAINAGISTRELEELAMKYDTREHALQLKRERIVVGGCSMDRSPRIHAQEIAVLAAETVNWDIFLRAHLDIMNDRFSRVSDGSWAWAGRKTYIRELEILNFDVITLLMGISLRVGNPSGNHYFASISRTGRALSESKDPILIEQEIASAIQDRQLDDYNRLLMYYLYRHYIYHMPDIKNKPENIANLRKAVATLPLIYSTRLVIMDEDFSR
ncbi:MAG: hypothetical protein K0Q79_53 [Flavipsychrobacter sp.]|jgi:hypothetical protein|nr:hypothetical protein [Flavipsychrobacter sp.]